MGKAHRKPRKSGRSRKSVDGPWAARLLHPNLPGLQAVQCEPSLAYTCPVFFPLASARSLSKPSTCVSSAPFYFHKSGKWPQGISNQKLWAVHSLTTVKPPSSFPDVLPQNCVSDPALVETRGRNQERLWFCQPPLSYHMSIC